ncbi:MFS transporter [Thermosipho affectus]|uniref:MFS transporter n=1 Tax=Thermosipho affectus TaxID=660294 RepID=A0ABX3II73_9BACT|nr:MFS transporter [Thermosipho affectus]ONN27540.1 MFS transporter [Thermosipho affectus]
MKKTILNKNFVLFIFGRFVSLIGSGIQMIAIPLYILDKTGSGAAMGIFTLLGILPRLFAAPFSGVLGDRFNRKNIMVLTDLIRGGLILLLSAMSFGNLLNMVGLFVIQAIVSVLDGFFGAATTAMLPDIVSEEDLRSANSILGGVNSFSMIIGPILGGVVYGFFGISLVFLFNGLSFVFSALSEMFINYRPHLSKKEELSIKTFFVEFKEGLLFIVNKRSLKFLFTFAMVTNFLMAPLLQVVEPYVLRQVVKMSAQQYGLVQTFFTFGMLLGNIAIVSFLNKLKNRALMTQGLIIQILLLFAFSYFIFPDVLKNFSVMQFFWIVGVIYFFFGFFNVQVNVPISTNLQLMTPSSIRSRVFSTLEVFSQVMVPLGAVIYGFLLDHIAAHFMFLFATIITAIISVGFLVFAPYEVYEPNEG